MTVDVSPQTQEAVRAAAAINRAAGAWVAPSPIPPVLPDVEPEGPQTS